MRRSGILQNSRMHLPACNSSSTIASIQRTLPQLDYNQASKAVETREALQRRRTSAAAPTHQRFVANLQTIVPYLVTMDWRVVHNDNGLGTRKRIALWQDLISDKIIE